MDLDDDELEATRILNRTLKKYIKHEEVIYNMNDYLNDIAQFKKVNEGQQERIAVIRSSFSKMYDVIDINCKNSNETKLALERLQEAQFWALKGISREENK